jgi:parallel beta-helix repeat protein
MFSHLVIENCEHGIVFSHSSRNKAHHCQVVGCEGVGYLIHGSSYDNTFDTCLAYSCSMDAFQIAKWDSGVPSRNILKSCHGFLCGWNGASLYSTSFNTLDGCHFFDNTGYGIMFSDDAATACTRNNVVGCSLFDDQGGQATQLYGLVETDNTDYTQIEDNIFYGNVTGPALVIGANSKPRNNMGYVTENKGADAIASGVTSKAVTHGCDYTPDAGEISVTQTWPTTNPSYVTQVDTITSTQFTVHCNTDPGVSTLAFRWAVRRI